MGWVFVLLAVGVAAIELWPVADAWWLGVSEWWQEVPNLLPEAARTGAMLLLPAAVAWGSPRRYRANAWLWKGALIIAIVQLLRYPVDFVRDAVIQGLTDGGAGFDDPLVLLSNLGVGLGLAVVSVLGVWALSEGVKDGGGRSRVAIVVAALVALVMGILYIVPSAMAGLEMSTELVTGLLSVAVNVLYLFAQGLLAGRAVAGVARRVAPRRAWAVGALGGVVLFAVPVVSLSVALANYFLIQPGAGIISIPFFNVLPFFGWPAVAIGLAAGMARLQAPAPSLVGTGFVMKGKPRATVPAA
ncbi:MAG TPA: hypothetical protein VFY23_15765 [Candidatus Limnocylindrales bacterium]|nr:hypothetical protein [Candidatus Limnocylindrales bacterium]